MGTATFVKRKDGTGEGRVYRLDPPIEIKNYDVESGGYRTTSTSEFVWVSATMAMFSGPETYIFACDADGEVTDWSELDGSYRGGLDHEEALRGAGYDVKVGV